MAAPANNVKIGLFVVLGLAAAVLLAVGLGAAATHKKTIAYTTYFNEPVTGLDVGAFVRARGVKVGRVGKIAFAPDHEMIAVRMDMEVEELDQFGGARTLLTVHPSLRAQLASQGLTGSRFVSIDFFDPATNVATPLSFPPPDRYIPAAKSQQRALEDSVTKAMDGLANLVDTMSREGLSEKTVQAMASANDVMNVLGRFVESLNRERLPRRTAETLEQIRLAVAKSNSVLEHLDGDAGLVAAAQASVKTFGEVGRNATGATRAIDETMGDIREAAAAVRLLATELEREPDALVKGRSRPTGSLP